MPLLTARNWEWSRFWNLIPLILTFDPSIVSKTSNGFKETMKGGNSGRVSLMYDPAGIQAEATLPLVSVMTFAPY